jgi:hypothetical protein
MPSALFPLIIRKFAITPIISIMFTFDPHNYGPEFAPLLETDRRRPLDAGRPDSDSRSALKKLSIESAFAHTHIVKRDMAEACISGLWLLHDCLDDSHTISQNIDTTSGSFLHAIMHRREGDFSNAKYWFRNVGQHPVFADLSERAHMAASLRDAGSSLGETRLRHGDWDPYAFVDLCQGVARGQTAARELCLDIQQAEWQLLFDHCYRAAAGK